MKIGHIIIIFFTVLIIIGCATQSAIQTTSQHSTGAGQVVEVWHDVRSINDLAGLWEGIISSPIPGDADNLIPESVIETKVAIQYVRDTEYVTGYIQVFMDRFLTDWLEVDGIKDEGVTKDDLWGFFVSEFDESIIVGNYDFMTDISEKAGEVFSQWEGKFRLNEKRDQLEMTFFEPLNYGLSDTPIGKIILNRKE